MKGRTFVKSDRIVELLKVGEMITCRSSGHPTYTRTFRVTNGESSLLIHPATIEAMIRRNIIHGPGNDSGKKYTLVSEDKTE